MKHRPINRLSAAFFTLAISAVLFSSCDKEDQQTDIRQDELIVDEFSLNRASTTLCPAGLKLRAEPSAQLLRFDSLVQAGQAKAMTFNLGSADCALKFSTYDIVTRTNTLSGIWTFTPSGSTGPRQIPFTLQLINSEADLCLTNGAAWQIQSIKSSNTTRTQMILKGLTELSSSPLLLETESTAPVSVINEQLGMTVYTCQ